MRELLRVALPLILSSGSLSLMYIVDRVFLTWYSTDALAAVMPAGMLHWTFMSVALGTATYVNTFVAQYEGAGRKDRVAASVWQGIYLSLGAGILFLLVAPLSPRLFAVIGHDPAIQALESQYFSIFCMGAVPITLSSALACFYSGRGETLTVMGVNVLAVVANVVLDYCLIFGSGPFPRLGIQGAALATVLSNIIACAAYFALMLRPREVREYRLWQHMAFDRPLFGRLLRYGLPTGFQMFGDIAGFSLFIMLVGRIGKQELAATNLAFNLNSLAFIPMLGFGTAVMTLVGRRIGERRPELAVRTTWHAFRLSALWMATFACIYLFAPHLLLAVYAANSPVEEFEPIRNQVVQLLRFVALYSFFDGMAIIFGSAVRGAGDTRFCLVFTLIAAGLLMVLPTWIAWWTGGGSLTISWMACTAYIMALGGGFLWRFRQGMWQTMRVIEESSHAPMVPPPFGSQAPPTGSPADTPAL